MGVPSLCEGASFLGKLLSNPPKAQSTIPNVTKVSRWQNTNPLRVKHQVGTLAVGKIGAAGKRKPVPSARRCFAPTKAGVKNPVRGSRSPVIKRKWPNPPMPRAGPKQLKRKWNRPSDKATNAGSKAPRLAGRSPAHETLEAHLARHRNGCATCGRCHYIKNRRVYKDLTKFGDSNSCWLEERPSFMNGEWALGCGTCAWHMGQMNRGRKPCVKKALLKKSEHRHKARFSKWGSFQVKVFPFRQIRQRIMDHGGSLVHLRACEAMAISKNKHLHPMPSTGMLPKPAVGGEDAHILRGRVPKAKDWLDAFIDNDENLSWRKQERLSLRRVPENSGAVHLRNLRKVRRRQIRIMARVAKRRVQQWVRGCQALTLVLDEAQGRKLVRFRCDAKARPFFHRGVLGIFETGVDDLEQVGEDNALRAMTKLNDCINDFCTLENGELDQELREHILQCVRTFAADGCSAERRLLFLAAERMFPRLVLIIRDSAHAIRIIMKDALHHDEVFGGVWGELFDKKDAPISSIQHSSRIQSILAAIQTGNNQPLAIPSFSGSPMEVVMKHFAFAKHRFDSTVDPKAKVALLLLPLCVLWAVLASDNRTKKEKREAARQALKFVDSMNAMALGVSADWGILFEAFLRIFDTDDHDIAATTPQVDEFKELLQKLTVDGGFLEVRSWEQPLAPAPEEPRSLPPPIAKAFQEARGNGHFITDYVRKQVAKKCVFNCDGDPVALWGPLTPSQNTELRQRLRNVGVVALERLDVEFNKACLRHHLRAFHMPLVRGAYVGNQNEQQRQLLNRSYRFITNVLLGKNVNCPPDRTQALLGLEYQDTCVTLVKLTEPGQPLATKPNREVWGEVLEPGFEDKHMASRQQPLEFIEAVIRFYISIEDGSVNVERAFAILRAFIKEHKSNNIECLQDVTMVRGASIPQSDLAVVRSPEHVELGEFGMECATLWRKTYGARLGVFNPKRVGRALCGEKQGTYTKAKEQVFMALARVAKQAPATTTGGMGDAPSLIMQAYLAQVDVAAGSRASPFWNAKFQGKQCWNILGGGCQCVLFFWLSGS